MYTAKFDAFLFNQISFIKFKKEPIKIKISTREEKITKIKPQMNEHEISIHVNNNSWIQIVQLSLQLKNIK